MTAQRAFGALDDCEDTSRTSMRLLRRAKALLAMTGGG